MFGLKFILAGCTALRAVGAKIPDYIDRYLFTSLVVVVYFSMFLIWLTSIYVVTFNGPNQYFDLADYFVLISFGAVCLLTTRIWFATSTWLSFTVSLFFFGLFVGPVYYFLLSQPAVGWDSLDWYLETSVRLLGEWGREGGASFTLAQADEASHERHGALVPVIFASPIGLVRDEVAFAGLLRFLLPLGFYLLWYKLLADAFELKSVYAAVVAAIASVGSPLLENHLALFGYSDPWVSLLILGASVHGLTFLKSKSYSEFVGFVFFCALLPFARNSGFVYACICILAFMLALFAGQRDSFKMIVMFLTIAAMAAIVATVTLLFISEGQGIVFVNDTNVVVFLLGRKLEFIFQDFPRPLFTIFVTAVLKNASFTLGFLSVPVGFVVWSIAPKHSFLRQASLFGLSGCASLMIFYLIFAASDYGANVSMPGMDTGGSRVLLPLYIFEFVLFGVAIAGLRGCKDNQASPDNRDLALR